MLEKVYHYISLPFVKAIRNSPDLRIIDYRQNGKWWDGFMQCNITQRLYQIRIEEVKKKEPVTVDQLIKEGGLHTF